jgi:hypothetical protein
MFEIIGIISLSVMLFFLLFIQYSLVSAGVMKESLRWYGIVISWIPLLPYIVFFIMTLIFIIMILKDKFIKWFELNWGWFFINARKQSDWAEHLRKKYSED